MTSRRSDEPPCADGAGLRPIATAAATNQPRSPAIEAFTEVTQVIGSLPEALAQTLPAIPP